MESYVLASEGRGGNLSVSSPRKIGLELVTEYFTTFFTASREKHLLAFTLGALARNTLVGGFVGQTSLSSVPA